MAAQGDSDVAMSESQDMQQSPEPGSQDHEQEQEQEQDQDQPDIILKTPPAPSSLFLPPSILKRPLTNGESYTYHSPTPSCLLPDPQSPTEQSNPTPVVLGVDEAGRGPVLGPMVYGVFYLPIPDEKPVLKNPQYAFADSKVLTPTTRSNLMRALCEGRMPHADKCGWAVRVMSALDISSGMLKRFAPYNLNAQAMDATAMLIQDVLDKGVNVKEIYVDTIGQPMTYQKKLERIFPNCRITVAKKADSLYPVVSAASVCAKVTRDAALEALYEAHLDGVERMNEDAQIEEGEDDDDDVVEIADPSGEKGWGSGYPSDGRCTAWLRRNMDPIFGWGPECRFSWGTAKDLLEGKNVQVRTDWPEDDPEDEDEDNFKVTSFFISKAQGQTERGGELQNWFGHRLAAEAF